MKRFIFLVLSIAFLFTGCTMDNKGNFQIYLTDQPISIEDAEHIYVNLSEIKAQKTEEGFLSLGTEQQQFDLIQLQDKEKIFVDTELEKGTYTQIRLIVESGEVVMDGETHSMTIPSSEVKIPVVFHVLQGGTTEIVLDFEAKKSIMVVKAGVTGQYILRPVIKVKNISY
ncbi:DUF4382 domain-containing protein [bacterium]|nr:DUF4382 domain-containing protein [bacterium]